MGCRQPKVPPGLTIDVADTFAAQFERRLAALPQIRAKSSCGRVAAWFRSVADTAGAHETIGHAPEIASALQLRNAVGDDGLETARGVRSAGRPGASDAQRNRPVVRPGRGGPAARARPPRPLFHRAHFGGIEIKLDRCRSPPGVGARDQNVAFETGIGQGRQAIAGSSESISPVIVGAACWRRLAAPSTLETAATICGSDWTRPPGNWSILSSGVPGSSRAKLSASLP